MIRFRFHARCCWSKTGSGETYNFLRPCCNVNRNFQLRISTDSSEGQNLVEQSSHVEVDLIERKRNKSRMPEIYHTRFVKKEMAPLINMWDHKPRNLRRFYAAYGKNSGLNPGIMWPSKAELQEMIEFEREFETPVQDMIRNIEEAKRQEKEERRKREEDVLAKAAKLDTWIQEFKNKQSKKEAEAKSQKEKRERILEEVQEYLGYEVSPKDPKFQEVLEQKELEEKKAKKAARKKDRQEKIMAKLLAFSDPNAQSSQPPTNIEETPQNKTKNTPLDANKTETTEVDKNET